ncbi:ribosome biogenesis protein BMS1 homolog [Papaver somniferum]|nr:ribosome biogenesis protein BMS1 homolog [Papaver somniferum]XP_026453675.1 ribosome biogenesis protein BMS1 homolog [Papaver somniferum]
MDDIRGPISIVTGKKARLQFVECPDDINAMVDAAKYANAVLLLVDASYGFEAETFEFLNLLQVHGFPKVMGVLTHLDEFEDETKLNETIKRLEDQFRTEICQAATIYNLSGLVHNL